MSPTEHILPVDSCGDGDIMGVLCTYTERNIVIPKPLSIRRVRIVCVAWFRLMCWNEKLISDLKTLYIIRCHERIHTHLWNHLSL